MVSLSLYHQSLPHSSYPNRLSTSVATSRWSRAAMPMTQDIAKTAPWEGASFIALVLSCWQTFRAISNAWHNPWHIGKDSFLGESSNSLHRYWKVLHNKIHNLVDCIATQSLKSSRGVLQRWRRKQPGSWTVAVQLSFRLDSGYQQFNRTKIVWCRFNLYTYAGSECEPCQPCEAGRRRPCFV